MDSQGGASSASLPVSIVPEHLGLQENAGRLSTNAQFQFFLDICKEKLWEYDWKPFQKANWKDFTRAAECTFFESTSKFKANV
jgi:hypothetical protein